MSPAQRALAAILAVIFGIVGIGQAVAFVSFAPQAGAFLAAQAALSLLTAAIAWRASLDPRGTW
jgi:hypothetical protein